MAATRNIKYKKSGRSLDAAEHDACGVGFVARLSGQPEHELVEMAVKALGRMAHRGGAGSGFKQADGAGILMPIPREFMCRVWGETLASLGKPVTLPGQYGVGQFFMPQDTGLRNKLKSLAEKVFALHLLEFAAWRELGIRTEILDGRAKDSLPYICQALVYHQPGLQGPEGAEDSETFERKLYLARKHLDKVARHDFGIIPDLFHTVSLSSHSIVYKGLLKGGATRIVLSRSGPTRFQGLFCDISRALQYEHSAGLAFGTAVSLPRP